MMTVDPVTLFGAFVAICLAAWLLIVWAIAGASRPVKRNRRRVQS